MPNRFFEIASPALRCTLCDEGASIARVRVRRRDGAFTDVALAPQSLRDGAPDPSLAGRTIGPCCGRVREGIIQIDGEPLELSPNEGANHLHGGPHGAAEQRWAVEAHAPDRVTFALRLPHGLDGYPGNRLLKAAYSVTENALQLVLTGESDRATWLGMTSHRPVAVTDSPASPGSPTLSTYSSSPTYSVPKPRRATSPGRELRTARGFWKANYAQLGDPGGELRTAWQSEVRITHSLFLKRKTAGIF